LITQPIWTPKLSTYGGKLSKTTLLLSSTLVLTNLRDPVTRDWHQQWGFILLWRVIPKQKCSVYVMFSFELTLPMLPAAQRCHDLPCRCWGSSKGLKPIYFVMYCRVGRRSVNDASLCSHGGSLITCYSRILFNGSPDKRIIRLIGSKSVEPKKIANLLHKFLLINGSL